MNKLIISVIIACYNAENDIEQCLESILNSYFPNFEVIVINDGSTDNTRKVLKPYSRLKKIKMYSLTKNLGPSKARNFGEKKAKSRYILFLDSDCIVKKDCLSQIVHKLDTNKTIAALALRLLTKDGNLDNAGHYLSVFGYPYEMGVGENPRDYNKEMIVFGAKTAGLALRKDIFQKIGGFDEDYCIYGEDTDLCWRIWLLGYRIIYFPQAEAIHFQKGSLNQKTEYRLFYEGTKNNLSNLLKNMPVKILFWMVPLHIFFLILLVVKLLLEKRATMAKEVLRGIFWNIINIQRTLKKRQLVRKYLVNDRIQDIMFGPLGFWLLAKKGWRWFQNV